MKRPATAAALAPSRTKLLLAAALAASALSTAAHGAPPSNTPASPSAAHAPLKTSKTAQAQAAKAAAVPDGESIGLYPLQLPAGQEQLQDRLLAQLHDGASSLPRVRAFDLIPRGACAADEGGCLAAAGRAARLSQMVSGQVESTTKGYRFTLRLFSSKDGAPIGEERASVEGGPLDLAGGLEHGVCALLGAAPCAGNVLVRAGEGAAGVRLFVDGQDQGALPLARPLALPVGRHVVKAGGEERRVRVSYHRDTRLLCEKRGGAPALVDDTPDATPLATQKVASATVAAASIPAPAAAVDARSAPGVGQARVGKYLLVGAGVLLAAAAGFEWYARNASSALDARYRTGALTDADKPSYGAVHTAGTTAVVLGAAGLGALGLGGLVLLLPSGPAGGAKAPAGAAVQGRF